MARAQTKPSEETAVSVFEAPNALAVLTDDKKFDRFYDEIKAETDRLEIDLTSETGRKRIASMAFKVARTKTAIDEAGKLLTSEWRDKIGVVDAARRNIRDRLDALKTEVRAPLTAWEEAEAERVSRVNNTLAEWREWSRIDQNDTSETVTLRLDMIRAQDIDSDEFGAYFNIAASLRTSAIDALTAGHSRLVKEEADREELDRLRAEAAARELRAAVEAEKRAEAEAAAKAEEQRRTDAENAARVAADRERQAEIDRLAQIKDAEVAAKAEAEAKAERDRIEQARAHNDALGAERARRVAAEAALKAEADRIERARQIAEADANRIAAEQATRDKDRQHRGAVMGVAKAAIMALGAEEDTAKKIVLAIVAGEIPSVTLRF